MTGPAGRRPRVVVVGGGFAGLETVRSLHDVDVDVLLLDRDLYSTFQPLLYQVATGGLNPGDVTYALRAVRARSDNARFARARVTGLVAERRRVETDGQDIDYDYLVLCCGVSVNFFGVPGAQEHAKTIYSRKAAIDIRDTLFSHLEVVAQARSEVIESVVVIVGAGPTGVEMAGTLAELRNAALPEMYPELDPQRVRIVLVEMTDSVLGAFEPPLGQYAADELRERGVELRLSTAVAEVRSGSVVLGDGEVVPSAMTIWASGVKVRDEVSGWGLPQGHGGRIQVDADMRVIGIPEIFAVGDVALTDHEPLPQLAQPAIQGGRHAGTQIRRLLEGKPTQPMRYRDKGTMATIGRHDAVLQLPSGRTMKGRLAWVMWMAVHIFMLMGRRNRLATFVNLAVRYASWPGRLNVIVGDPPEGRGDPP